MLFSLLFIGCSKDDVPEKDDSATENTEETNEEEETDEEDQVDEDEDGVDEGTTDPGEGSAVVTIRDGKTYNFTGEDLSCEIDNENGSGGNLSLTASYAIYEENDSTGFEQTVDYASLGITFMPAPSEDMAYDILTPADFVLGGDTSMVGAFLTFATPEQTLLANEGTIEVSISDEGAITATFTNANFQPLLNSTEGGDSLATVTTGKIGPYICE